MITRVQFGNIFNVGGRQVLGGSNSGYDTQSLIEGLTTAKRLPAVKMEDTLKLDASKQEAYTKLKKILGTFKETADHLRNPPGVQNSSNNIFSYRAGSLSSSSAVAAENYLDATIEPGTDLSNYTITVDQLATYNLKTTAPFALASLNTSVVGGAGPLNAGTWAIGPHGTSITLNNGDTLQQVVNKFNAVSDTSEIRASAIQVSPGNYALQLKSTTTGAAMNYALPGGLLNIGLDVNQSAVNAELTIDNTTIIRSTNSISDAIDGITFDLKQPTPMGTSLTLDVKPDTEIVKNAILNFVDSYNELRVFISQQTELGDDGKPAETAVLYKSGALRSTLSNVVAEMSHVVDGITGGDPDRLSELGITFTDFPGDDETPFTRNILTVDEDVLDGKLASDFDAVRKVFEFDFSSSDSEVQVFKRTNSLDISSFSLNIDITGGVYQATYNPGTGPVTVNLTGSAISGGGYLLTGQTGTVLEGLQMIYSGTTNTTSSINISQGIGDRIFNSLEDLLNEDTGQVPLEVNSLTDSDKRLQEEIDRIDELVARYRDQLLSKFTALENALASINTVLQSLDAQANANANG